MPFSIVADENIDYRIIQSLRNDQIVVDSIFEFARGITDQAVLEYALERNALILTEDKDFGEWIFSHRKTSTGIILLRFAFEEIKEITKSLLFVLNTAGENLYGKFVVIRPRKIRIRTI